MDLAAIAMFVRTFDAGSFVAAGRQLGVSASGIGKSISRLEQGLGVRLFHRSTRSLTLTAEGELFLERARRILAEVDGARADLAQARATPQGRLKIGLPMIGEPFLEILTDFQLAYPDIELELHFENRQVDVIAEGYDAVIRTGDIGDSGLNTRLLDTFRMLLVGAPAYFARRGVPATPDDLLQHDGIQFRMPASGKLQHWELTGADGVPLLPHLPTRVTCNTNEARLRFATKGLGIAYMSHFAVRDALADGTLVTVLDDWTRKHNTFRLLWPSGRSETPKLRAFIDFVKDHAALRQA